MQHVVASVVFALAGLGECFPIFDVVALIMMTEQLAHKVSPVRNDASMNQRLVAIAFDEWRDAEIKNEQVDKLLHVLFDFGVDLVHVRHGDGPVSEAQVSTLLFVEVVRGEPREGDTVAQLCVTVGKFDSL